MNMNRDNLTLWLERLSMFAVILSVAVIILLTVQSLDPRLLALLVGADTTFSYTCPPTIGAMPTSPQD